MVTRTKFVGNYCDELRALVAYAKKIKDEDTPVEIRINLASIPDNLEELGTHRCIEYFLVNDRGEFILSGQGWSLDDAFKEAKQDFFDVTIVD